MRSLRWQNRKHLIKAPAPHPSTARPFNPRACPTFRSSLVMFRCSADVVVTLGFHYGPIRAPVQHLTAAEEEEITAGPAVTPASPAPSSVTYKR